MFNVCLLRGELWLDDCNVQRLEPFLLIRTSFQNATTKKCMFQWKKKKLYYDILFKFLYNGVGEAKSTI